MNNYWTNKEELKAKAIYHTSLVGIRLKDQTNYSISKSAIYTGPIDILSYPEKRYETKIIVDSIDSVKAINKYNNQGYSSPYVSVLNFASYKNPGGKFLEGSSAQEESLCHASNLYNVLSELKDYYEWNKKHLSKALYMDRAVFSPSIVFLTKRNCYEACNVITCAAPNYTAAKRYCNVSEEDNIEALKSRINFLLTVLAINNQKTIILGAFGCGVFGQNPTIVANIFKEFLNTKFNGVFENVVFAIPDVYSKNYIEFFNTIMC